MRATPYLLVFIAIAAPACNGGNGAPPPVPPPAPAATPIASIQGSGSNSPLVGQTVTIEAVVTGDFQDNDTDDGSNLGGFFVQTDRPDGDPSTSEGLFVFDGTNPSIDVAVGDRVTVRGEVQEFFGDTQINATTVTVSGSGTILPTDINLPVTALTSNADGELIADLEMYEGMLVRFPQTLTVTELRNIERWGEARLSQGGRLYQFTNVSDPDMNAYTAHREATARRSVLLDDGRRQTNAAPIQYLDRRVGDTITGLTGVLRYSRGSGADGKEDWRLMPVGEPQFAADNPRPAVPVVSGALHVASFNVLNLFSNVDTGDPVCGPAGDSGCRGADSVGELNRQLSKISAAVGSIDADIVGLIELENNASGSLEVLVNALNLLLGGGTYAYVDAGAIGDDAIKVGFLYKPATVTPVGAHVLLTSAVDARFDDTRNRPVLAQAFRQNSNAALLTVAVAHLKSKGSPCDDVGDPNTGDGQANCNQTRTSAATALADWLLADPTGSGDSDFLLIGDLNAYLREDPLQVLVADGRVNLVEANSGADAYSFIFDGQSGALDHAIASPSLVPQVAETVEWHINADESAAHDYNLEAGRDPAIFEDSPYRSSDHDPVIVGLDLVN